MPSPVPLPEHLRRVMVSFRILPAVLFAFRQHVPEKLRSRWLEEAVIEKLDREGVKIDNPKFEEG